jgi:YidC/Oxa1 family membrane protein insertase
MWNKIIINPLYNTLQFFIAYTHDIGISIILFTIVIKTLLLPLNISASKTSKNIKKIQPHIDKLKTKHKNSPREMGLELSKLYKEHKIKPLSGILSLFIQMPILFGLYRILLKEIGNIQDKITFFNIDVTKPNIWLAVLTFITMAYLMHTSSKDMVASEGASDFQKEFTRMMSLQMKYFLPGIVFVTSIFLPAGLTLYFVVSNLFAIGQFYLMKKIIK